ncbi:hypothetical protein quinque_005949 [Culex quinquefasciatus]
MGEAPVPDGHADGFEQGVPALDGHHDDGEIIAILCHSKTVCNQCARDRVLSSQSAVVEGSVLPEHLAYLVPVAAVSATLEQPTQIGGGPRSAVYERLEHNSNDGEKEDGELKDDIDDAGNGRELPKKMASKVTLKDIEALGKKSARFGGGGGSIFSRLGEKSNQRESKVTNNNPPANSLPNPERHSGKEDPGQGGHGSDSYQQSTRKIRCSRSGEKKVRLRDPPDFLLKVNPKAVLSLINIIDLVHHKAIDPD